MKFTATPCECCDDVAIGITCSIENLQRDEDNNIFLTMSISDMAKVFTQMNTYINGGQK